MNARIGFWLAAIVLTVGCQSSPPKEAPADEVADELTRLREAPVDDSRLEVRPLTDPAIESLLQEANRLQESGELAKAAERLAAAKDMAPTDPEVLQRFAELELKRGQLESAAALAMASFKSGPQVGRLCHRNWLTFAEASRRLGDEANWHQGMTRIESCQLKERERL